MLVAVLRSQSGTLVGCSEENGVFGGKVAKQRLSRPQGPARILRTSELKQNCRAECRRAFGVFSRRLLALDAAVLRLAHGVYLLERGILLA